MDFLLDANATRVGNLDFRTTPNDPEPSLTHPGVGTAFSLAMSVGARGREASLENALSGARRFGLSGEEAGTVAEQLVETVRGWRDHFASVGCSEVRYGPWSRRWRVRGSFPWSTAKCPEKFLDSLFDRI